MIQYRRVLLSTEPMDMRAGPDKALVLVVIQFGAAQPNTAYVFLNKRANRLKVLVQDGLGIWLAARRLHQGRFASAKPWQNNQQIELTSQQLKALLMGLPWHYLGENQAIEVA